MNVWNRYHIIKGDTIKNKYAKTTEQKAAAIFKTKYKKKWKRANCEERGKEGREERGRGREAVDGERGPTERETDKTWEEGVEFSRRGRNENRVCIMRQEDESVSAREK